MGRKSHCTDVEYRLVKKLRDEGKTYKFIPNTLGRSKNFLTNAPKQKKGTRGSPRKTGLIDERRILMANKDPFVTEDGLNC